MTTALLLVDHGSLVSAANDMLWDVARLVSAQCPDLLVEVAHMELALPSISDGISVCVARGATHIVVHPYMLSPGRHATQDIPRMVQEFMVLYPLVTYHVTEPLGLHPLLATVVLDRANLRLL